MPSDDLTVLPLLSRGRHRNPRRGACFMELAAFLAGERWSDHPACTHPLLAELARQVNDATSDEARPRLALLAPSVVGLTSDDVRWSHEISLLTATSVLPVVGQDRRAPLAVGILTCERMIAASGGGAPALRASSLRALEDFPVARDWARAFTGSSGLGRLTEHPGRAMVTYAVRAVVDAGRPDTDDILRALLADAVDLCARLAGRDARPRLEATSWRSVCEPVALRA